jgi:hypothetical protein
MNKFVLGALALSAASSPALATTDNWSVVDKDLESLATSLAPAANGASVSGFIRSSYATSSDLPAGGVGGNDLGGFSMDDARLLFTGGIANFNIVVETEASTDGDQGVYGQTGTVTALFVLDAYASWNITEELKLQMGNFRAPFLASSHRAENNLLFIDRSLLGTDWAGRDMGIELGGNWGMWGFMAAIQNGVDSAGDDLAMSARVYVTPMGQMATHEGSLGATGDPALTIGAGYYNDDGTIDNRTAFCVDAAFTVGIFSASAEMVDYDQGIGLTVPADVVADATPWNVAVGVMAIPDQLEFGVRYEDLDDAEDSTVITIGANWYMQGHNAKWQANYSTADSDDVARDGDVIQVGLTVSI